MSTSLDSILSGEQSAAPEQEKEIESVTQEAAGEAEGQAEQQAEGEQQESDGRQKTVPHQALHAERQKVKRYTEEVADLRKEIADRDAAWDRRIAQLMQAQQPKAEPPPAPDFFENPQAATRHEVTQAVGPQFDGITQQLMAQAQMLAGIKYGDDKVQEAEQAFMAAYSAGQLDPADIQRVSNSPNRYAAAVQWHQRRLAQAEIGDDPAAYRAKLEAELREKITAELNGNGQQGQQQPPAARPNNLAGARNVGSRSGPAWAGPTPIADIFAGR